MLIKELYKYVKRLTLHNRIKKYVSLDQESFYDIGFDVDIRKPKVGKCFLKLGKHCMISGAFVFETDEGNISIGDRVHIGNSMFISRDSIIIEDDVTIAWDCILYDHNSHSANWNERKNDTIQEYFDVKHGLSPISNKNWSVVKKAPIHICSKAWIGVGCKILKGVTIGEGAIVAAGSVVVKDVESWTLVGGNPACFIRKIEKDREW